MAVRFLTDKDLEHLLQTDPQELTAAQQLQARINIGAVSSGDLGAAVEDALTEAKESGKFDGPTGPQGEIGPAGAQGAQGPAGYTPVRGTDYWTDADKAEIKTYVDEAILGGEW